MLSPNCHAKESPDTLEIVKSGLDQLEQVLAESERKEEQRAEDERKLLADADALPLPPNDIGSAVITPTELESPMSLKVMTPIMITASPVWKGSTETPKDERRNGSKPSEKLTTKRIEDIEVNSKKREEVKTKDSKPSAGSRAAAKAKARGSKAAAAAKTKARGSKAAAAAKAKAKARGSKAAAAAKAAAKTKASSKAESAAKAKAKTKASSKAESAAKAKATRTKRVVKEAKESKPETQEEHKGDGISKIDENAVKRKLHSVTWEHFYFEKNLAAANCR